MFPKEEIYQDFEKQAAGTAMFATPRLHKLLILPLCFLFIFRLILINFSRNAFDARITIFLIYVEIMF